MVDGDVSNEVSINGQGRNSNAWNRWIHLAVRIKFVINAHIFPGDSGPDRRRIRLIEQLPRIGSSTDDRMDFGPAQLNIDRVALRIEYGHRTTGDGFIQKGLRISPGYRTSARNGWIGCEVSGIQQLAVRHSRTEVCCQR